MTQAFVTQTDFTAGELDPRMLGRTDLRSYQSGAAKLRNVVVEITGGVRRRPGTAYVANAAGRGRLVAMETGADQAYLLAFSDFQVKIFRNGVLRATVATPWNEAQVSQIAWAQRRQSLLVTHPDVHPQQLTRESDTVWSIGPWQFAEIGSPAVTSEPFARFAAPNVTMQSNFGVRHDHRDDLGTGVHRRASRRDRADRRPADPADQHPDGDPGGGSGTSGFGDHECNHRLGRAGV